MANRPTREEIELRAYEIYLERGAEEGRDVEDWLEAESQLSEGRSEPSVEAAGAAPRRQRSAAAGIDRSSS
jgi:hypothetical protein